MCACVCAGRCECVYLPACTLGWGGAEVGWCVGGGWVGGSGKDTNLNATGSMGEGKRASIQPIRMPAAAKARKNAPHLYAPHRNLSESSTHMKRNHVSSHIYIFLMEIVFCFLLHCSACTVTVLCCVALYL